MAAVAFLFDVDNTLIDNDRTKADLAEGILQIMGAELNEAFWRCYEEVRAETELVDLLGTLQRFASRYPNHPRLPHLASMVLHYPSERWLYPGALEVISHLSELGTVAVLSDGDAVYQAAKIARAGIADAVGDNVLIYVHKQEHLEEVAARFPADRHVLIDDKPLILADTKRRWGSRVITVQVDQGKYAHAMDPAEVKPPPDIRVAAIRELLGFGLADFGLNEGP